MLRPYKKRKFRGLRPRIRTRERQYAKLMLKRHGLRAVKNITFSDEKLFRVQQCLNAQSGHICSVAFEDSTVHLRTAQRFHNSSSVIVWAGVSDKAKFPLIFIEKGIKVDSRYCHSKILEFQLKPEASRLYPEGGCIFQQDLAPAHKAKWNQEWFRTHCPDFSSSDE